MAINRTVHLGHYLSVQARVMHHSEDLEYIQDIQLGLSWFISICSSFFSLQRIQQ